MIQKLTFLLCCIYFSISTTYACSCWGPTNFCETVASDFEPDIIVKAVKTGDIAHGMTIKIQDLIAGSEQASDLTVWGDNGFLCRVYTSLFEEGDELILGLHRIEYAWDGEAVGDYELSVCGTYYLPVTNGLVEGSITPTISEMAYSDFADFASSCVISSVEHPQLPTSSLEIYPNPVQDEFTISIPSTWRYPTIELYDLSGRQVQIFDYFTHQNKSAFQFNTSHLPTGIYLVKIRAKGIIESRKIVVQH